MVQKRGGMCKREKNVGGREEASRQGRKYKIWEKRRVEGGNMALNRKEGWKAEG